MLLKRTVLGLVVSAWLVAGCALLDPPAQPGDIKVDPTTGVATELDTDAAIAELEAQIERLDAEYQALLLAAQSGTAGNPIGQTVAYIVAALMGGAYIKKRADLEKARNELALTRAGGGAA